MASKERSKLLHGGAGMDGHAFNMQNSGRWCVIKGETQPKPPPRAWLLRIQHQQFSKSSKPIKSKDQKSSVAVVEREVPAESKIQSEALEDHWKKTTAQDRLSHVQIDVSSQAFVIAADDTAAPSTPRHAAGAFCDFRNMSS